MGKFRVCCYDTEFLPHLDQEIRKAPHEATRNPAYGDNVALLALEKDKILRLPRRDSSAWGHQLIGFDMRHKVACEAGVAASLD